MTEDRLLLVLPFPGVFQKFRARAVQHNAAAISSYLRAKSLIKKLWIQDGVPITVELCIAYNVANVTFISIEFREILSEKDVELSISPIQSAEIVCAGYLLGSVPSMDERHWCNVFNKHPRLATIDIDVRSDWVKVSPTEKYNNNNSIKALHIFSEKDK